MFTQPDSFITHFYAWHHVLVEISMCISIHENIEWTMDSGGYIFQHLGVVKKVWLGHIECPRVRFGGDTLNVPG